MSGIIPVRGLEHTGVLARDTAALAEWYRTTFDANEIARSEGPDPCIFLSFGRGSLIELVQTGDDVLAKASDHVHLCLAVDDLDVAVAGLERNGVRLDQPIKTAFEGSRVAFFRDPEGNLLQFVQRVPNGGIAAAQSLEH